MGANELSAMLWRERELLELLIFKLEEEHLLLESGKSRWLQHATREVEQVLNLVREATLSRSVQVAAVANEWRTDAEATLRELVLHAPAGPWGEILNAHLKAMSTLTAQIKELRDVNENFLRVAARSAQESVVSSTAETKTYNAQGATGTTGNGATMMDQNL
ncbi:flagellar protein FlgN [Cryobacterium sp. Hh7]|uniref:flagellar export chaperone FlgN n=1 Tax=unclassified Cryobacterium TaxID=2649013 RepID=UPI00106C94C1|nr:MULTISPECIES: flagellar export chaperone FlgN [unclassified Cryobacterium]TFD51398.1 flagellar protein FlgN [Cryobacterium sp. Hh11]TFD58599.1 flagellar protein FlgN [Cryobacterium sp. Hh7]